jgi:ATP-dependent exoDNAse (exonuclease V) alpha subunit
MLHSDISSALEREFTYTPTEGQKELIKGLSNFLCDEDENKLYVVRGYAGTGKTTLISALVKVLPQFEIDSVLLAPTGRAAKVLAGYSGKRAHTIHQKIYFIRTGQDGKIRPVLQRNTYKNTLFIVDEASMIYDTAGNSDTDLFSGARLLEDLLEYIRKGKNCKLIFIGDTAQLPPVGMTDSPALDMKYLNASFQLNTETIELTEVVRQSEDSGILCNATFIRQLLKKKNIKPPFFQTSGFSDVIKIAGNDLEDALNTAYSTAGRESTLIVCRSNKRANIYNREIRSRILGYDQEIVAGDLLMCVRNNYYWLPPSADAGFIANGDILEIIRVRKTQELYGFRFADVQVRLLDYPDEKDLEIKIMLDTLSLETPALPWKENTRLYEEVIKDYEDIPKKYLRIKKVKENPFFNAIQVKYAYALTCHKSQGGQWQQVFLEQGYLTDDMINSEYIRWLYTAVTRATQKLYLVNFAEKFFRDND